MAEKVDVLVIGGGSIGLNSAYYLTKAGRSVTVVDAAQAAAGSSAGNAGHIVPSHIVPLAAPGIIGTAIKWMLDPARSPFGMRLSLDPAYLRWLLQFALACNDANVIRSIPPLKALGLLSAQNFADLVAEETFDCSYQSTGLLFLYQTAAAFAGGQHEAELLHQNGMPAEILDAAQVKAREPAVLDSVIGGVHFTGDASLDPAVFLSLLAGRLRQMGAQIEEHDPVTGYETRDGRIRLVRTRRTEYAPQQVVLAAGAWSPPAARGLGLRLPVQAARGYSLTMPAVAQMPRQALLLGERRVAVTPMGDRLRFTGRLELSGLDTRVSARQIAGIERAVREYISLDANLKIEETWAGLRPTTPDGLPLLGISARYVNLIIAAGHAMLGLSLGPGTGQVVAELAAGNKPSLDLAAFRPERFG